LFNIRHHYQQQQRHLICQSKYKVRSIFSALQIRSIVVNKYAYIATEQAAKCFKLQQSRERWTRPTYVQGGRPKC